MGWHGKPEPGLARIIAGEAKISPEDLISQCPWRNRGASRVEYPSVMLREKAITNHVAVESKIKCDVVNAVNITDCPALTRRIMLRK